MAKLVPHGKQSFFNNDGDPLAGGFVYMYVPGGTVNKDTWQNEEESVLNSNPIILDGNGRTVIYGNGTYRQLVKANDGEGNPGVTIWDKEVAVYSERLILWAGTATGTANNITATLVSGVLTELSGDPVGGQLVFFMAGVTNTGPVQLTVLWAGGDNGPVQVSKNTSIGPAPLVGGEIVAGNLVQVFYDDASGQWIIINPLPVATLIIPAVFSVDQPFAGQTCVLVLVRSYSLAATAPGSVAYAEDIATGSVAINIRKNGTVIGTVTFTGAANAGVIVLANAVEFVAGDRLVLEFPSSVDATLGALGVTFKLTRAA